MKSPSFRYENNMFSGVAAGFLMKREILCDLGGYDEELFFPEYRFAYQAHEATKTVRIRA